MKLKQIWNEKTKKQKVIILSIFLLLIAVGAYAAVNALTSHAGWDTEPGYTARILVEVDEGSTSVGDLLPGDSFTISPTIKSQSTADTLLFLRIDCETLEGKPIYTFIPTGESASDWTVVESDEVSGILVAYGDESTCTEFHPDEELNLTGKVTLDVTNAQYAALGSAEKLKATFNICMVHADAVGEAAATSRNPGAAYSEYLDRGGE